MGGNRSGAMWRRGRTIVIATALTSVLGGALYRYESQAPEPSRAAGPARRPPVPVTVAVAAKQDGPVYLTGIGSVQAWFPVKVHP